MAQTLQAIFYHGDDQARVDHTPSGALICGEVVNLGSGYTGVVTSPEGIAANVLGSVATAGKFKFKKASGVTFSVGDIIQWDDTNNTAVAVSGDWKIGICVDKAAASGDDYVIGSLNEEQVD